MRQEFLGAHRFDPSGRDCPVLLVGEDNPVSTAPEHALYPHPEGCAGHRLAGILGLEPRRHLIEWWRTNLCNPTWSKRDARSRARALVVTEGVPWRTIVMLGRKVAEAFQFVNPTTEASTYQAVRPFESTRVVHRVYPHEDSTRTTIDWITLVSLPHPSGRCRDWNFSENTHRARALLEATIAPGWYEPWP